MAHRTFKDRHGRTWEVWEVQPTMAERRAARQEASVAFERRKHSEPRASLPDDLRRGWLAFESRNERRRLAPPPRGWSELSDADLVDLLEGAAMRVKPRRLLD